MPPERIRQVALWWADIIWGVFLEMMHLVEKKLSNATLGKVEQSVEVVQTATPKKTRHHVF